MRLPLRCALTSLTWCVNIEDAVIGHHRRWTSIDADQSKPLPCPLAWAHSRDARIKDARTEWAEGRFREHDLCGYAGCREHSFEDVLEGHRRPPLHEQPTACGDCRETIFVSPGRIESELAPMRTNTRTFDRPLTAHLVTHREPKQSSLHRDRSRST